MITVYKTTAAGLETLVGPTHGCWLNVVAPSPEEIDQIQDVLGVPADFVNYPLDLGEIAHTEKEDAATLIVLRVPYYQGETSDIPYTTTPLGIILTGQHIATVCKVEPKVLSELVAGRARGLSTAKRNRFVLQLLLLTASRFLANVQEINRVVDETEDRLQASLRNKEILDLLKYQKSLVYFTTALTSNELMLQHLQRSRLFQQYPDDADLLEHVITEIQQAIQMTNISSNILSQMMDAYASIISNNLNVVMKILASLTIVVSLPTLIASLYGMNVPLPFAGEPWAFAFILVLSLLIATIVAGTFWKRDWL